MQGDLVDREEEIESAMLAVIGRVHLFLLGGPGIAKSYLLDRFCAYVHGAKVFGEQLDKFMVPDLLYGQRSLLAMKEDRVVFRTEGFLPTADIVRLGECFKGSSAILQTLLTAINERKFKNDGVWQRIPLSSVFADSNELPQSEELGPLWDRLIIRRVVAETTNPESLLRILKLDPDPSPTPILSWTDVQRAQVLAATLPITDAAYEAVIDIRQKLKTLNISPTPRRLREAQKVMRAAAFLAGASSVEVEHLECLVDVCWERPEQRRDVARIVLDVTSPGQKAAIDLADSVAGLVSQFDDAMKLPPGDERDALLLVVQRELKRAREMAKNISTTATGRALLSLQATEGTIAGLADRVVREGFGL